MKKKDKDEKRDPKAASAKIDENEFPMSVHAPPGGKWVILICSWEEYMWAGSLMSPPLGSIPCYGSPRFRSSDMELASDDPVDCLKDRCSSLGPEADQCRERLAAVQKIQRVNNSQIPTFIVLC